MTTLHIQALDTLFFKDGRPFSMGEETWAQGVFPPFPSVFYGLLRSIWFSNGNLMELSKGSCSKDIKDPSLALSITGLLPAIGNEVVFPIPNDLYALKHEKNSPLRKLQCKGRPAKLISDYAYKNLLLTEDTTKIEELGGKAFISKEHFADYLENETIPSGRFNFSDYVLEEPKVGIGREQSTRTAAIGQLYGVAMRRMHGKIRNERDTDSNRSFGFMVRFEHGALTMPDEGVSRFGGEIKAIEYRNTKDWKFDCTVSPEATHFKIYLATPAIFNEGVYPEEWFRHYKLRLLTTAAGRVLSIGGFDMKKAEPKPMRKAVPAGTVYYVECEQGNQAGKIIELLHGQNIYNLAPEGNTFRKEYQREGFGHCYLGNFKIA